MQREFDIDAFVKERQKEIDKKLDSDTADWSLCLPNCADCCDGGLGFVMNGILNIIAKFDLSEDCIDKLTDYFMSATWLESNNHLELDYPCCFLYRAMCLIYEERPDICREYLCYPRPDGLTCRNP